MNELLRKAILGMMAKEEDIESALYDVCDEIHSGCDNNCPVYRLNGSAVPMNRDKSDCRCFKDGKAMLKFIRGGNRIEKL